jgi:FKBP-type peptidyl-prolyl cis-trans isomerase FkpA
MQRTIFQVMLLLLLLPVIEGCKPKYRQQEMPLTDSMTDPDSVIRLNQMIIKQNAQNIRDHATGSEWKLKETGTGVFYQIFRTKASDRSRKIVPGDRVSLTYTLKLLDGTVCYSSAKSGLKQFVVEKSQAEQGLHETVQLLHPGDSALVVIPPHRAFGLVGDGNRIPPGATLVYEIRVDAVSADRIN